ncbi:MAG: hypothetical protein ACE5GD_00855 [Candidatus Geothermarchaeales archaeon]
MIRPKLLILGLMGIAISLLGVGIWLYDSHGIEFPHAVPRIPWAATLWLLGIITLLLIPLYYCVLGES